MKISFLLAFLFLLTIQAFGQGSKYNNADIVNIRVGAGINYAVVGQLAKGEKVTVISESNEWTQIATTNGLKGYVATSFLSATSSNTKKGNGKANFVVAFFIGFLFSLIPFLVYNGATTKKDGRSSTGYRVIKKGWNFKTSSILLFCTAVGIVFSFINFFSKTETTPSITEKSNPTETPKTQDTQVTQEPQTTNQKYQSHNFYGNNVTEYLEVDASGNVFYSTSTRPNPVKMIVKKIADDEFELTFPSGAGDNQRYRMRKASGNLVVFIPNTDAKEQVYTAIKASANANHGWKTFKHKYGFSIELPDYFSEGILSGSGIQSYTDNLTQDVMNKSNIIIETLGEGSQASLATAYHSTLKSSDNVVYNVLQNNWFVVTGQDANGIYYLKTTVKNGQTHYLSVRYPVSQKEQFDKILPRIVSSFQ